MNNIHVCYLMDVEPTAEIACFIQDRPQPAPEPAFAVLTLGYDVSIHPSIRQLIAIRDAIDYCLETWEAKALAEFQESKRFQQSREAK